MDRDWAVACICITLVSLFLAYEAGAANTKEERRAERRATEIKFETCMQECRIKCGREGK